jgi:hypothetical protein
MRLCIALLLAIAACGESLPRTTLLAHPNDATPEVRTACELTQHKCTRCHTIGRVLAYDAKTRADWEPVVLRMRRMASSGITSADASTVLSCLVSRE